MELTADLVIMGGGLAGMTLALQVRRAMPSLRIVILERNTLPADETSHKIGESTVEVAAHYFARDLGLQAHLEEEHLPKLGQRFFWTDGVNDDVGTRLEFGCRGFPKADTYQIARGRFENHLADRCMAERIELLDGVVVKDAHIGAGDERHRVAYRISDLEAHVSCRWLVDASGGAAVLRRSLGLQRPVEHSVSSAWMRVQGDVAIDDWNDTGEWKNRHGDGPRRRLSVNHLMGHGYWVWLIPLSTGATSIGIVADESIHPVRHYNTAQKMVSWLEQHEPQCGAILRGLESKVRDFGVMKNVSRSISRAFSPDRWFITGVAGAFVDPFYSPGSDFIAYANTLITDLIVHDEGGDNTARRIESANRFFLGLTDAYFDIFTGKYPLFGNRRLMPLKVCWDWSSYWTYNAFAFCHGGFAELPHDPEAQPLLRELAELNGGMQRLFVSWGKHDERRPTPVCDYIDWTECEFLQNLNRRLVPDGSPVDVLEGLRQGLKRLHEAAAEIVAVALEDEPALASELTLPVPPASRRVHYTSVIEKVFT